VILRGQRVLLRPLDQADVPRLAEILAESEVARWWGAWDEQRIRAEILEDEETEPYAVVQDGELIGLAIVSEELDPDYRHAALDLSLATSAHGHGLGGETLRVLARHLFNERGHHRLTIDPAAHNTRAIRAYERVGFRPVGVMRLYERGYGGTWHDGLLMDLLAADFEG
jgi:aminoglycoside 6'-N-acetyltransferase